MTGKAKRGTAKRKVAKRKGPSMAEMKRQIAAQKARADQAELELAGAKADVATQGSLGQGQEEVVKSTGSSLVDEDIAEELATNNDGGMVYTDGAVAPAPEVVAQDDGHGSLVDIPGVVPDKQNQEETLPATQSTYSTDQVLAMLKKQAADLSEGKPAAKISDIHVKKYEHAIEAASQHLGKEGNVEGGLDKQGDVELIKVVQDFDPGDKANEAKQANILFMRDWLIVDIQDTSEKNADPKFFIGVNGRQQIFVRGRQHKARRYFVEGLARAKPISYGNEEYTDPEDGVRKTRHPTHIGVRYPFVVVHDPNPRGREWLTHVLAQP